MIHTKQLEHLVKLAILSAYVEGERPVSLLISARVESGKTEIVRKSISVNKILYLSDVTAYGLQKEYLDDLCNGKYRTIVIPDLITPLSRSPFTVDTFIAFLNGLIEEGVARIATYAMQIELTKPVRCNIITCIAKEHLEGAHYRWSKVGFLSRVIPVSYSYSPSTVQKILNSVISGDYHDEPMYSLRLPKEDKDIGLPVRIGEQVVQLTLAMVAGSRKAGEVYGFRLEKQLITLCKASALFRGRDCVDEVDFDIISALSGFINLDYKQI